MARRNNGQRRSNQRGRSNTRRRWFFDSVHGLGVPTNALVVEDTTAPAWPYPVGSDLAGYYDVGAVTVSILWDVAAEADDVVIAFVNMWEGGTFSGATPSVTTPPTGWTSVAGATHMSGIDNNGVRQYVYWKQLNSTDISTGHADLSVSASEIGRAHV